MCDITSFPRKIRNLPGMAFTFAEMSDYGTFWAFWMRHYFLTFLENLNSIYEIIQLTLAFIIAFN